MKDQLKKVLIAVAMVCTFTVNSNAQEKGLGKTSSISIGPELILPVGKMNDTYKSSLGGSVQLDAFLADHVYLIGNVGFTSFNLKSNVSSTLDNLQLLPIKVGVKVFPIETIYLQGSMGVSLLLNKSNAGQDKDAVFAYAPQVGLQFKVGKADMIDTGINFQGTTKFSSSGKNNAMLGMRIAYGFGL